ncbi:hypothetical protein K6Y31_20820 [Motilimonas cestriensis]|uniref:Uncharacterized protein n=1 Tax=Motilimonas cestriensis TaxID=2742685 RepID=A0ABS8WHU4_9GAMM|nr:hypothetical protein [Motilimonas cestriensis]MCE2597221.1 hypothetical protein [Motilimonas cestriensis]
MKKIIFVMALAVSVIAFGGAEHVTLDAAMTMDKVGFFSGLWHGFSFVFAFWCSMFADNTAVYAIYNNGEFYDAGFFIGIALFVIFTQSKVFK